MLKSRRTGGDAPYPPSDSYLINPVSSLPPSKSGGACSSCNTGGGRRYGGFFADAASKNASGSAAQNTADKVGGGRRRQQGGAPVELTAFISALALLGARLLADKNSSFNLFSSNEQREEPAGLYREEQVGGVRRPGRPAKKATLNRRPRRKDV